MKNRGFTLIELLVTITIIAVLSAIGLVIYSSVLRQGRDSRRQSDLRSIQSALEQYFADQFFYPSATLDSGLDTALKAETPPAFTSSTGNPSPPPSSKTYINSLPQDPTDSTGTFRYRYEAITSPSSYCLYARLENGPSPAPSPPAGCTYPSAGYNFVVTPP